MIALRCAPAGVASTQVVLGIDLAADFARCLDQLGPGRRSFAVVDAAVATRHADRLAALPPRLVLAGGEAVKSFASLERVLRALAALPAERSTVLVVAGGGSLGDLGGLAAALYARGLDLVLVPTTLLAMVDSSVGGKTAIDLPEGKNLVGALHPARLVAVDFAFLDTLAERDFRSGLGELLKVALGLSVELFAMLEECADAVCARDKDAIARAVHLALAAKIALVEADFAERGPRRLLNLGHTLGHALEAHSGYELAHGLAVARGLHFAVDLAQRSGCLAAGDARRAGDLLRRYGFTADPLPPARELLPFVQRDKKTDQGAIWFVLPTAVGASTAVRLPLPMVAAALDGG